MTMRKETVKEWEARAARALNEELGAPPTSLNAEAQAVLDAVLDASADLATENERLRAARFERLARAIREEIVRQYRDDDRGKCPAGASYWEEHVQPELLAKAAMNALGEKLSEGK